MLNLEQLSELTKGTEITQHYLNTQQDQFKLFRHAGKVYAVKYVQKTQPLQAVEMWSTQKNDEEKNATDIKCNSTKTKFGQGQMGAVFQKNKDGTQKVYKRQFENGMSTPITKEEAKQKNISLLEQKFLLVNNNIDNHFVMGLWNIKGESTQPEFVMPAVKGNTTFAPENASDEDSFKAFDNFIIALRKLNQLGFAHPDYASSINHLSFNAMKNDSNQTVMLIDLDDGFDKIQEAINSDDKYEITLNKHKKNQWIYACNFKNQAIIKWEVENPDLALSDYPHELIKLTETEGSNIYLPSEILKELKTYISNDLEIKLPEKPSNFEESYQDIKKEIYEDKNNNNILEEKFNTGSIQISKVKQLADNQQLISEVSNSLDQVQNESNQLLETPALGGQLFKPAKSGSFDKLRQETNNQNEPLEKSPNPNCCKLAAGIGLIFVGICTILASIAAIILSLPMFSLTAIIGTAGIGAGIAMIGAGAKLTHYYKKQLKDLQTAESLKCSAFKA